MFCTIFKLYLIYFLIFVYAKNLNFMIVVYRKNCHFENHGSLVDECDLKTADGVTRSEWHVFGGLVPSIITILRFLRYYKIAAINGFSEKFMLLMAGVWGCTLHSSLFKFLRVSMVFSINIHLLPVPMEYKWPWSLLQCLHFNFFSWPHINYTSVGSNLVYINGNCKWLL